MRASLIVTLVGFLSLTVSCAHKQTVQETAKTDTKIEKKVEKKKEAKNQLAYTCLVGKDKRTITLDKKEKRCEVQYKKFGDQQQVAWAENTPAICDRAFNSIRSNIEGSGFKCADGLDLKIENKKETKEVKKPIETAATETK